jgi:putative DNA-invertase from lambdoid prophage Rac
MKCALYCRVSTSMQTTQNQAIRLKEYATARGWDYELFEETQSTRKSRPIKYNLLQRIRKGEFDTVVVYKLDRWARSSQELINEISEIVIKRKVNFVSISDNIDFNTATGRLHFQILSAFAEFERALISERVKEGLHRAKHQGKRLGRKKGSKDKKPRGKSGYIMRHARERQARDKSKGINKDISTYIDKQ